MNPDPQLPDSLWAATAEPAAQTPPLEGEHQTDVVVVGGGFTGLSTTLHLAERAVEVICLEQAEPGWGASGRNGGQVVPLLKQDPDTVVRLLGPERGERLNRVALKKVDLVFDLIKKHNIACDAERSGSLQVSATDKGIRDLERRREQMVKVGHDISWLDRETTCSKTGTNRYRAGIRFNRAGKIQPLSYARGLARAALGAGANIHGRSPVTAIERKSDGSYIVTTPSAAVHTNSVVVATNAYTEDLMPEVARSFFPLYSFQVATTPLSDNVRSTVLSDGEVCADPLGALLYWRLDAAGRLLIGNIGDVPGGIARKWPERVMSWLYPQADGQRFEYQWSGRLVMTHDLLPHLHEPAPGMLVGVGFNGRGITMGTMMGKLMAERLTGATPDEIDVPISSVPRPVFQGLRVKGLEMMMRASQIRDLFR